MDPNQPPSFVTPPASRVSHQRRIIAIVLAALVLVIAVGFLIYTFSGQWFGGGVIGGDEQIVLASMTLPVQGARVLANDTSEPLMVEGQGTAVLLDEAEGEAFSYYLIANQEVSASNLYRIDNAEPSAGLSQLTDSATLKFDLTYDEPSGVAAYTVEAEDGSLHVVVWDPSTEEETDLGSGSHPVLLLNGFFVVFQRGGTLLSVNTTTQDEHELMSIVPGMPFAVDPISAKVALYAPQTSEIHYFSIAPVTSASYESAAAVTHVPEALVYREGRLVTAHAADGSLVLSSPGEEAVKTIPLAGLSLAGYKLTLHHVH